MIDMFLESSQIDIQHILKEIKYDYVLIFPTKVKKYIYDFFSL